MTIELNHRQRFPISRETYWRDVCLSLEYQERLYLEALGCTRMEVLENAGSYEQGIRRRLRFTKPIQAPAAITKLFGAAVTLEEHSSFDAETELWSYRMIPSIMGDRIDIRGRVRIEEVGGEVEQVGYNSVTCRLFGLGAIIEPFVARSTEEGHADKTAFTRRYVVEKGLARR